jgi:hypothetical protein
MATKTVAEKLQIKPNTTVWVSDPNQADLIGPLPAGTTQATSIDEATSALIFAPDAATLRATLDAHRDDLTKPSIFWVAYPKANRSDINRDTLWPILTEYGMRPNSQIAIDEVWSALRFRPMAAGEAPFIGGKSS